MKFRNTGAEKKNSKTSELTGKKAFSSRTVVGVICIEQFFFNLHIVPHAMSVLE